MQLKRRIAGLIRHLCCGHFTLDSAHLFDFTVDQKYSPATRFLFFAMKKSGYVMNRPSRAINMHKNTSKHPMNNGTNYQEVTNKQKLQTEANYLEECNSPSKLRRLCRPAFSPKPPNNVSMLSNMNPVLDKLAAHLTANLTPLSDQSPSPQDSYDHMRYSPIRKAPDAVALPPTPLSTARLDPVAGRGGQSSRLSALQHLSSAALGQEPAGDYAPGLDLPLPPGGEEFAPQLDLISRFSATPSANSLSIFSAGVAGLGVVGSRCPSPSSPSSTACSALRTAGGGGGAGDAGAVGDSNRSVRGEEVEGEEGATGVDDGLSSRVLPTTTTATRMDSTAAQRPASAHTSYVTVPSVGFELSKTAKARYAHLRQQHKRLHPVERQPLPTLHLHLSKDGSSPLPPGWHRAPNNLRSRQEPGGSSSFASGGSPPPREEGGDDGKASADRLYPYYYYHVRTRQTRWDPPVYPWDADPNDDGLGNPQAMFADDDPEAPYNWGCASKYAVTHDEIESMYARIRQRMLERQCTELLHELAGNADAPKGAMEQGFAIELFTLVHNTLRTYRDARCKLGRILNDEDLYYLTKKLSQAVILKEVQKLHQAQANSLFAVQPEVSPAVQSRVSIYVRKYIESKGAFYRRRLQQQPMPLGPAHYQRVQQPTGGGLQGPTASQQNLYQQNYQHQHHQQHYPFHQPVGGRYNHRLPAPQYNSNMRTANSRQAQQQSGNKAVDQQIGSTAYQHR